VRILLVDDHAEVRTMLKVGMRRHPDLEVVGEAESVATALRLADRVNPQTIVLDLYLPDAAPREAFAAIREGSPGSRLVLYSARESSREWYERQGVAFFSKVSDGVDDLIGFLQSGA
jgi:DNA-binding NarL/FixJ family response regulator